MNFIDVEEFNNYLKQMYNIEYNFEFMNYVQLGISDNYDIFVNYDYIDILWSNYNNRKD